MSEPMSHRWTLIRAAEKILSESWERPDYESIRAKAHHRFGREVVDTAEGNLLDAAREASDPDCI